MTGVGVVLGAIGYEEWTFAWPAVQSTSPGGPSSYELFSLAAGGCLRAPLAFTMIYGYWAARDRVAQRL